MPIASSVRRVAAVALLAMLATTGATDACSYAEGVYLVEPTRNATAVPTDVELWLSGSVDDPAHTVTLEGDDGVSVPFTVRPLDGGSWRAATFLLRPAMPLRPRARYTFKDVRLGVPQTSQTVTFETGDGPSASAPVAAIAITGTQAFTNTWRSSCGYNDAACVGFSYRGIVDVVLRRRCDGATLDHYLARTAERGLRVYYDGYAVSAPFCAELRARRADGALGPAATFCTDPATTAIVSASCALTCADGALLLNDEPVGLPPNDRTPDRCLQSIGLTPERWTEVRARVAATRVAADSACPASDGGATADLGAVADAEVTDAPATVDSGLAATPDAGATQWMDKGAQGCGCRAATPGGAAASSAWWIIALVLAWKRRRAGILAAG